MDQQLKALTVLPGDLIPPLAFMGTTYTWYTYIHACKILIHIK